jgi:histidine decarboxylase
MRAVRIAASVARRAHSASASVPPPPAAAVSAGRFESMLGQHRQNSQPQQRRFKSSLPESDVSHDEDHIDAALAKAGPKPTSGETAMDSNTLEAVADYTSDKTKSGTPSPWAVFDAWGAGEGIADPLSAEDEARLSPESVKIPFTDDERAGMPDETSILSAYDHLLKNKSSVHFGYPYNLMYNHEELYEFMKYSINNLGDPYITSNYGVHSRQFECSVIDFFARLWKIPEDEHWGYVTTCGTEGNLHGILLARECHPDGILYTSRETHYSVLKAARYYRMDARSIQTLATGEIDYDALAAEIGKNLDKPVIMNVNIGTTVKGAVDDLDRILRILSQLGVPRERFHIHCDGALFAMMMPFVDYAPEVSFRKPIDSIAVSGHKMLGCPMPCGITISRKEHVKKVEQRIDYLNSVDTTIMGSRNGQAALYLWYSLRKKGIAGIKRDVMHCINTARYLRKVLHDAGFTCRLNDLSSTVVLERPMDDRVIKRWQLACEEDIAHVVVMPNVTREKIDRFLEELIESREEFGRMDPVRDNSPLSQLMCSSWGGEDAVSPKA